MGGDQSQTQPIKFRILYQVHGMSQWTRNSLHGVRNSHSIPQSKPRFSFFMGLMSFPACAHAVSSAHT